MCCAAAARGESVVGLVESTWIRLEVGFLVDKDLCVWEKIRLWGREGEG